MSPIEPVAEYYARRLTSHGATPAGVDWSSAASQQIRFDQLLRILEGNGRPSLIDYGCGYGALAQRLIDDERDFSYVGFDVVETMVAAARSKILDPRCSFTARLDDLEPADFVIASGIFNVKLETPEDDWVEHTRATLRRIADYSRNGFAFNMLTRYADRELMRSDLYYADPGHFFDHCKATYSRNVALLHDYDLYEFTLLVRLGSEPKPLLSHKR